MEFSTVPLLFLILVSFIAFITCRAKRLGAIDRSELSAIYIMLVVLVTWGITNAFLSISGIYRSSVFLSFLPGLWLPIVPIIICVSGVILSSKLRSGLSNVFNNTPWHYFIYIQSLRILAIGSILKAIKGVFPANFAYFVGIPDFLFGISSLYIGYIAFRNSLSEKVFMIWNLIGALVVTIPALLLFQTGLPGPIQFFTAYPTTEKLLYFPMVMAPSLIVPVFILLNLLVVWRLMVKMSSLTDD